MKNMKRIIFVLGSQRSGTNVLRQSLSADPKTTGFNESSNDELFDNWFLRPESEIREFIQKQQGTVLIKPIKSVLLTSVKSFLREFSNYDIGVSWIYRDPVNVFYSRRKRWSYLKDVGKFTNEWSRINQSALDANDDRINFVGYENLAERKAVFEKLCKSLGINGKHLFKKGHNDGYANLEKETISRITRETRSVHEALQSQSIR